jgi:serine/threonine-protein kinase
MAELFLAIHRGVAGFEKLLVIKRIVPSMSQDRAFIEMLLHEARIAARLSHPNIAQVFDVGRADGQYFIAMEHVHGEDLRSIVRQMRTSGLSSFPFEHALAIALGMCAALSYAHEKRDLDSAHLGIVHRDVSPQNVLVTFSGDVKIVDFGLAKSAGFDRTKTGTVKGKAAYMSPEQAREDEVDARSDLFAIGIVLFELTTGKRLFKGRSDYETLRLICDREYPRPSDVHPDYPAELESIVMRAIAKRPSDRYQSAREMQADLEAFVRSHQIAVSSLALAAFMRSLFAESLARQEEALRDLRERVPRDSPGLRDLRERNDEGRTPERGRARIGALLAGVVVIATIGAVGYWLTTRHSIPSEPHASRPKVMAGKHAE